MKRFVLSTIFCAYILINAQAQTSQVLFSSIMDSVLYRIPAIASTKDGSLIAVTDNRHKHGNDVGFAQAIDIMYRVSNDYGKTWNEAQIVADCHADYASYIYGFGDASMVADRCHNRQMLLCVGDSTGRSALAQGAQRVFRFYSDDNGKTWSKGENISASIYRLVPQLKSFFIGSGKIHQSRYVKKGKYYRLYCSLLTIGYGNAVVYSDDFGETWALLGDTTSCCPKGDEPKTEELPDGSVILSSRTTGRYFNIFRFDDKSYTTGHWAEPCLSKDILTISNQCNGEILAVKALDKLTHRKVWLYLQSVPFGPGRTHVSIYYKAYPITTDWSSVTPKTFGKGWVRYEVTTDPSAYSTFCLQKNSHIGFLYERTPAGKDWYDIDYRDLTIEEITGNRYKAL